MKVIDIRVGETVDIKFGDKIVTIYPQRKSGVRVRLGISADKDVYIGNPEKSVDAGV